MHGDGIMPKRLLGKAFGVAAGLGAFRPGVTVAVQRHAVDAKTDTTLLEFGRPVASAHPRQIGKQQPFARQILQRVQCFPAQMKDHRHACFLPGKADGFVFPIHVLGFQTGDVPLTAAQMPAQLVKSFPFQIFLTANDGLMFFMGDGPFLLEVNRRPLPLGNDGSGNPIHIEGEIVNASQKDIR